MIAVVCKWAFVLFLVLYVLALIVLVIGTFGLFGQEQDPLSGVFLMPLGLPWNLALGGLGESVRPWAAALAPVINLVILRALCRWLG